MSNALFEEITTTGKELLEKVKELVSEGNIRRIVLKNAKGKTLLEVPLSFGVVSMGAAYALAPFLSALSFFALFLNDCSIVVERFDGKSDDKEVEADAQIIEIVEDDEPKKPEA
jgi:hypothetical protein